MTRRDHEDLGDAELSPEDEARAEDAIQQAELDLKGLRPPPSVPPCPEGLEPPWVIVDHGDGYADILPAMRPGTVFASLPMGLAGVLMDALNQDRPDVGMVVTLELWKLQSQLQGMKHDAEVAGAISALAGLEVPSENMYSVAFTSAWARGDAQANAWIQEGEPPISPEIAELVDGYYPSGYVRIASERRRHFSVEGWTPEHDAEHTGGELAMAAASYASPLQTFWRGWKRGLKHFFDLWPSWWDAKWDKRLPKPRRPEQVSYSLSAIPDRQRELEKAGALCAAEIDRLEALKQRMERDLEKLA